MCEDFKQRRETDLHFRKSTLAVIGQGWIQVSWVLKLTQFRDLL